MDTRLDRQKLDIPFQIFRALLGVGRLPLRRNASHRRNNASRMAHLARRDRSYHIQVCLPTPRADHLHSKRSVVDSNTRPRVGSSCRSPRSILICTAMGTRRLGLPLRRGINGEVFTKHGGSREVCISYGDVGYRLTPASRNSLGSRVLIILQRLYPQFVLLLLL